MTLNKPLPAADVESTPFWSACKAHRLEMQRCSLCMHYQYPPATFCEKCQSVQLHWQKVSGRGSLFTWIVVRHPIPREVFCDEVPYAVGLVELEEGPRLASNIIECPVDSLFHEMPLEVVFQDLEDGTTMPKFKPLK